MEILGLAVLLVIVGIYYGFFDSAETVARMANRKVERLEAEQIKDDVQYYANESISEEDFTKAVAGKKLVSKFRDL